MIKEDVPKLPSSVTIFTDVIAEDTSHPTKRRRRFFASAAPVLLMVGPYVPAFSFLHLAGYTPRPPSSCPYD